MATTELRSIGTACAEQCSALNFGATMHAVQALWVPRARRDHVKMKHVVAGGS